MLVNVFVKGLGVGPYKEKIDLYNFIESTYDEKEDSEAYGDIDNYINEWYRICVYRLHKYNEVKIHNFDVKPYKKDWWS